MQGNISKAFCFNSKKSKNSIDLLYDDDDISIVSLDLLHQDDGELDCNRNRCHISHEAIMQSLYSFRNKPIICRLSLDGTRVTEHARNEYESNNMRVVGIIPNDVEFKFIERENGKTYLNCDAILYKKYCPQVVNILKNNNGELEISIEILAEGYQDKENGIFNIDSLVLQGVCLLDPSITQGIEGSKIQVVKFSNVDISGMNQRYLQFSHCRDDSASIFNKIKNTLKEKETTLVIGNKELEEMLWTALQKYKYHDGEWEGRKYYIEEIYPQEHCIIVRDNETAKYYKMDYAIDNDEISIDESTKKEVRTEWHERTSDEKRFSLVFDKEEYGAGETLKVNKSKEALSDKKWGEVDKADLRHKVLKAKNYKTIVYDVYAEVEDGWEDAPSSKLKYPIMLINGDELVYSRYGLASALGYAKAEKNQTVVDKVEKLYKELEIKDEEENMDNESKNINNKLDAHNPEIEKIKDDADALEDNEKEKLANTVGIDLPQEKKLKDDVAADKDYWKKQYEELKSSFDEMMTELKQFKSKEDKQYMNEYLNSFKKCFSEDDLKILASEIENSEKDDFVKKVDEKVKEFALKLNKEEEKQINNSYSNIAFPATFEKGAFHKMETLDDVYENLIKMN